MEIWELIGNGYLSFFTSYRFLSPSFLRSTGRDEFLLVHPAPPSPTHRVIVKDCAEFCSRLLLGTHCGASCNRPLLCTSSDFDDNPHRMLTHSFGKDCICHLQDEYVMVRLFWKSYVGHAVGGRVEFDGADWWSGRAGCCTVGNHYISPLS
jgi:hypothetical protein